MKPENYIIKLIHELSEPARVRVGRQRQIISLDQLEEPMTFILHSGIVAVYRTRDRLLLKFIEAPMIVGMNDLIDTNAGFICRPAVKLDMKSNHENPHLKLLTIAIFGRKPPIRICMP